jgi:ribosomal protein S20
MGSHYTMFLDPYLSIGVQWYIRPGCSNSHTEKYMYNNKKTTLKQRNRLPNNETITKFKTLLKKTWESVYIDTDPNHIFNSFICNFLKIFQASFPIK